MTDNANYERAPVHGSIASTGITLAVVLRSVFFALCTRFVLQELTPSVMAILQYRIAALPTEEERVRQTAALEEVIAEAMLGVRKEG